MKLGADERAFGLLELWIPITLAAAFLQNLRMMLQKHLKSQLSTNGVTYARFIWALPLAVVFALVYGRLSGQALPQLHGYFALYALIGGVAQILATVALVALFSLRNFAVGISFSKTETVQTALVGLFLLGDQITLWAGLGILISLIGVIFVSVEPKKIAGQGLLGRAALLGLASGAFFGVASVAYRAASLSLESGDFLMRAAVTLAVVTVMQTALMTIWMRWRQPGEMTRVIRAWRLTSLVGLTGMLGSLGWFAAFTLQNAAYVRALGQVELIFTFLASWLVFKEVIHRREMIGIALLLAGIVLLLLRA